MYKNSTQKFRLQVPSEFNRQYCANLFKVISTYFIWTLITMTSQSQRSRTRLNFKFTAVK